MLIPDRWYVVLDANEISAGRPLGIKRLGELMVFWRDENGQVVVMKDRCPHRSSQLSLGRVVSGRIQCPFHGFEFDGDGACQLIPANGRNAGVPKVFQCSVYPSQECTVGSGCGTDSRVSSTRRSRGFPGWMGLLTPRSGRTGTSI